MTPLAIITFAALAAVVLVALALLIAYQAWEGGWNEGYDEGYADRDRDDEIAAMMASAEQAHQDACARHFPTCARASASNQGDE